MAENPPVTSKFDRDHGQPRTPGKVTHPGGTAPVSGTTVPGHTEHGHQIPREQSHGYGAPVETHHAPHAGRMQAGESTGHRPKATQYDRRKGSGEHG